MKLGIYSDIHSNAEALDAVLKALDKEHVDRTICLGDLVGYGPDPNRCVEAVIRNADEIVAGNHDLAAAGILSIEDFNDTAAEALIWTRGVLSPSSEEFLARLPLEVREGDVTAVHATPEAPDAWRYIWNESDVRRNLGVQETPFCFVGHSHVPAAFIKDNEGNVLIRAASEVRFRDGWKYLINVGSVGQPRDGDPRAAYGLLDTSEGWFRLIRLEYAVDLVQKKMAEEGLPGSLIQRLALGQ
ncbi:MAG TPA: metallophosphoesterase family protein [bacterium]